MKHFFILSFILLLNNFMNVRGQVLTAPSLEGTQQLEGKENVLYYTGGFSYSIPIFTIKEGNLTVPVSLTYNAGIRVADVPSWCGLGWTVSGGGIINRTVLGIPDETGDVGFDAYAAQGYLTILNGSQSPQTPPDDLVNGVIDGEPDIYNFSLPGHSGKFIKDKDGRFVCSPSGKIFMQPDTSAGGLGTPNFLFSNEANYSFMEAPSETHSFKYIYDANDPDGSWTPITTIDTVIYSTNSWYLTNIHSWQGNDIDYQYDNFFYGLPRTIQGNYYFRPITGSGNIFDNATTSEEIQYSSVPHITEIDFTSGKILFIPTTHIRYDLPVAASYALDKIVILNKEGAIIKQFKLRYDYWHGTSLIPYENLILSSESNLPDYQSYNFDYRLLLKSVTELDANGNPVNSGIRFEYDHSMALPSRNSTDKTDYWGYFNNLSHNGLGTATTSNPWYYQPPYNNNNPLQNAASIFDLSCLEPTDKALIGNLTKIKLPTGVETTIAYDNNQATFMDDLNPIPPSMGAGIRVSYIDSYDSISNDRHGLFFDYDSAYCASAPTMRGSVNVYSIDWGSQLYEVLNINRFSSNDERTGYGKVTVNHMIGNSEEPILFTEDIYRFATPYTYPDYVPNIQLGGYQGYAMNAPHTQVDKWKQGRLLSHEHYITDENSNLKLQKKLESKYDNDRYELFTGVRIDALSRLANKSNRNAYTLYKGYTGTNNPVFTTETTYDNGDSIVRNTEYFYTPTNPRYEEVNIATINRTNPDNSISEEHFLYANNYTALPVSDNEPYDWAFYYRRFRSLPIEHVVYKREPISGNWLITGGSLYSYTASGDLDSIRTLQGVPFSIGDFQFSNTGYEYHEPGVIAPLPTPDPHYKLTQKFRWGLNSYNYNDGMNERIDYTTGDTTTYISWLNRFNGSFINGEKGASGGYPSVVVEGAGFEKVMSNLSPSTWSNESAFNLDINHLRTELPDCNITTMRYKSITGPISITDSRGKSILYEYDGTSRLRYQMDGDGNVLQMWQNKTK